MCCDAHHARSQHSYVELLGQPKCAMGSIVSDDITDIGDDDHGGDIREYIDTSGHWLDYTIERGFTSSQPPARLVRFMPLEQYLSILTTRQLYIPRATEYDDPYDCAFPGSLSDAIKQALVDSCNEARVFASRPRMRIIRYSLKGLKTCSRKSWTTSLPTRCQNDGLYRAGTRGRR